MSGREPGPVSESSSTDQDARDAQLRSYMLTTNGWSSTMESGICWATEAFGSTIRIDVCKAMGGWHVSIYLKGPSGQTRTTGVRAPSFHVAASFAHSTRSHIEQRGRLVMYEMSKDLEAIMAVATGAPEVSQ